MHRPAVLLAVAGLSLSFVIATAQASAASERVPRMPDFSSWSNGAGGYAEALRRGEEQRKPVLVYFYTDWCGYCRQFEQQLLSEPELDEYLDSIVTVRVNPEAGPDEAAVARRYGVQSFPSLFVHSGESPVVSQVDRVRIVDRRPVLMTPAQFIDVIKTAGAR
jgi:thiol:disulfide interchange protein